jgi:hypothetical protein
MEQVVISFNSVIETEVRMAKQIEISHDEMLEFLILGNVDKVNKVIEMDEVTEVISQQLNEMLLSIVPDERKNNCVSMVFTDIKVTLLQ